MDFGGGESPSRAGVRHISDGGGRNLEGAMILQNNGYCLK